MQNHYFGGSNPPVASNIFLVGPLFGPLFGLLLGLPAGCAPAVPEPSASYVEWRAANAPVDRPLAVFVDRAGGPMDGVARDWDVTTFLNDRFHALLVPEFGVQPLGSAAFYSADGCLLYGPFVPSSGSSCIVAANQVIVIPAASGRTASRATSQACAQ